MRKRMNKTEILKAIYEELAFSFQNPCVVIESLCNAYMELGDIEFIVYAKGLLQAHINNEFRIAEGE